MIIYTDPPPLPSASLQSLRKSGRILGRHLHLLELKQPRGVARPGSCESNFIDHFTNDGHPLNIKRQRKATGCGETVDSGEDRKQIHLRNPAQKAAGASRKFEDFTVTGQTRLQEYSHLLLLRAGSLPTYDSNK